MANHPQVMGYKNNRQPYFLLQFHQQIDNLCLNRYVQGRHTFITHQKFRLHCQRPCDTETLPLPAGKFMGKFICCILWQSHHIQQTGHFFFPFVKHQYFIAQIDGFQEHISRLLPWIQCRIGILKYNLDMSSKNFLILAIHFRNILPFKENLPLGHRKQPHHQTNQRRLPAARFSHNAQRFSLMNGETHIVHGFYKLLGPFPKRIIGRKPFL